MPRLYQKTSVNVIAFILFALLISCANCYSRISCHSCHSCHRGSWALQVGFFLVPNENGLRYATPSLSKALVSLQGSSFLSLTVTWNLDPAYLRFLPCLLSRTRRFHTSPAILYEISGLRQQSLIQCPHFLHERDGLKNGRASWKMTRCDPMIPYPKVHNFIYF